MTTILGHKVIKITIIILIVIFLQDKSKCNIIIYLMRILDCLKNIIVVVRFSKYEDNCEVNYNSIISCVSYKLYSSHGVVTTHPIPYYLSFIIK